jgi:glutamate synthase (ferredoxin)
MPLSGKRAVGYFERIVEEEGQTILGWRDVPTDDSSLGETAKASEPFMEQVFIQRSARP